MRRALLAPLAIALITLGGCSDPADGPSSTNTVSDWQLFVTAEQAVLHASEADDTSSPLSSIHQGASAEILTALGADGWVNTSETSSESEDASPSPVVALPIREAVEEALAVTSNLARRTDDSTLQTYARSATLTHAVSLAWVDQTDDALLDLRQWGFTASASDLSPAATAIHDYATLLGEDDVADLVREHDALAYLYYVASARTSDEVRTIYLARQTFHHDLMLAYSAVLEQELDLPSIYSIPEQKVSSAEELSRTIMEAEISVANLYLDLAYQSGLSEDGSAPVDTFDLSFTQAYNGYARASREASFTAADVPVLAGLAVTASR